MENPFTIQYSKLEDWELLKIIEDAENYQPIAIEAANSEIAKRNLSAEQLASAKEAAQSIKFEREKSLEKIEKAKSTAFKFTSNFRRSSEGKFTANQYIGFLSITFLIFFIIQVITLKGLFALYLTDISLVGFSDLSILLPFLILMIGTWLFWQKFKSGWILMVGYSIFSLFGIYITVAGYLYSDPETGEYILSTFKPSAKIFPTALFIAILLILFKTSVRDVYKVNKQETYLTMGLSFVITCIMILPIIIFKLR